MTPDIYEVTVIGKGRLFVMPCPRSTELGEAAKHFIALGVHVVVSHLEKPEERELGLSGEGEVLVRNNIEFISFPVQDRCLPDREPFFQFIDQLFARLENGENIAVHCRAGIGRTGVTSACLLIKDGYESDVAMDMVAAARGTQIPDTEEQYDFICEYPLRVL